MTEHMDHIVEETIMGTGDLAPDETITERQEETTEEVVGNR
jgi:hypothetical protein